jgi:CheY-like chemotaxis protein
VLLNLCVNARDAMPKGGRLQLRAENCRLDAAAAKAIPGGRAGAWLVLHIQDSGTGMPPEVLARIWDAFYTTKAADKGTGLGLSTVRGIVENHQGFIEVRTVVGSGSTFRIYFPATDAPAEEAPTQAALRQNRGRGEGIMVVDDEEPNREILREILEANGYSVVTAADGAEAVKYLSLPEASVALVITDYEMPVLHGEGLTRIIIEQHSSIKVLMISGSNRMIDVGCHAKLLKPYAVEELLRMVDNLLHEEPDAAGAPRPGEVPAGSS